MYINMLIIHMSHKNVILMLSVFSSVIAASVICLCSLSGSVNVIYLQLGRGLVVRSARKYAGLRPGQYPGL